MIIVWLGNNAKAIIVTAISVGVFGTILNIYTSFAETDSDKILLIQTLGGSRKNILTKVVLPASLKTIISNMKVNIGLSLVGVIIGEFLAAKAGLGYLIIYGSQVFKMDWVAMSIVILCIPVSYTHLQMQLQIAQRIDILYKENHIYDRTHKIKRNMRDKICSIWNTF